MGFRCAVLGCGGRSRGHANAYKLITRGKLVAICDMNEKRLKDYGDAYGIATRYTNFEEMLRKEKPDLLHIVTPPTLRVGLMTQAAEAGVRGVIVEKPICIGAEDYKALRALNARSKTKFVVNHQLRFHPKVLELLKYVRDGHIGQLRFIDASAVLPMSGQGVHVMDLAFAFNGYAKSATAFAGLSGYDDINGTHPSPKSVEILVNFENGVRALIESGQTALRVDDSPNAKYNHMHKRIAVYGTNGFVHWRMSGWERSLPNGTVETGKKSYAEEDNPGQAGLTNALMDWIEDDKKVHPNCLATSLDEWLVLLAAYGSAVQQKPITFPYDPPDDLLAQFQELVGFTPKK
jgi:predicted dehydrogenase